MSKKIDQIDRKILNILQRESDTPLAEIAATVNLSQNACWRRIKILEENDVIKARVAILNPEAFDKGLTVFVSIRTGEHHDKWLKKFTTGMDAIPEVMEFYRLSGDIDYLLKILVKDVADYDRVYKKIIAAAPLRDVSSSFSMEDIKVTTQIPLD